MDKIYHTLLEFLLRDHVFTKTDSCAVIQYCNGTTLRIFGPLCGDYDNFDAIVGSGHLCYTFNKFIPIDKSELKKYIFTWIEEKIINSVQYP